MKNAVLTDVYRYYANVTKVYDGDTFTIDWDLGAGVWKLKEKIRLWGINTPEVRGVEKEEGKKVRDYVRGLILDKKVIIETFKDKQGKYGRYIANVKMWNEDSQEYDIDLTDHLLKLDYGVPYLRD